VSQEGATIKGHQDGAEETRQDIPREAVFEVYQEAHDPSLGSLIGDLREN
jgi:hypothetical protein